MGAYLALLGIDRRHAGHGFPAAGPPEGLGDPDADHPDHLLLPLHLLLYSLRQEDTQEVLPVHTLLILLEIFAKRFYKYQGIRGWSESSSEEMGDGAAVLKWLLWGRKGEEFGKFLLYWLIVLPIFLPAF